MVLNDIIKNVAGRLHRLGVFERFHARAHGPSELIRGRLRAGQQIDGRMHGATGSDAPITLCYVLREHIADVWAPRARALGARARRCTSFPRLREAREEAGGR